VDTSTSSDRNATPSACGWQPLERVLVTAELDRRPAREPDHEAVSAAIRTISAPPLESPVVTLQKLVDAALELCRADSAGVSVLETVNDREQFRWHAISGAFARNVGGGMPRWSSPCGTVLDENRPLLFQRPEHHYPYQIFVQPPIVEALLVPFHLNQRPVGTVWVIAHTDQRQFDNEDVRILTELSRHAAAAVHAMRN
jgi:GAF domain-containing protein